MLNDVKNNDNEQLNIDIFNIDYENQNIENNINFKQWKESIINKHQGKGNVYKCPFEKHYFYGEEKEYSILCPSCHKKIIKKIIKIIILYKKWRMMEKK